MKIGFIADIHEDIKSLKKAISTLEQRKCHKIVCLGDIVGYSVKNYRFLWSRDAHEVINVVKKKCAVVLVGNHDLFAVRKIPKFNTAFKYPSNWYSLDFNQRKKLSKNKLFLYEATDLSALLQTEDQKYIKTLPEFKVLNFDGLKIFISHYAYPELVGDNVFVPSKIQHIKKHFEFIKKHKCTLSISGHDHREGIVVFTEKSVTTHSFKKVKLSKDPTWLIGPAVVNGSFANGVMVLDTKKLEIEAIPLNSKRQKPPEWR